MIDLNRIYALEMMRKRRLATNENVAKWYVTVTAGATHTINQLVVSAATVVDWDDGNSDEYTGASSCTHIYDRPGTYCVRIMQPENVNTFDMRDTKVSMLNSSDIKSMVNIKYLSLRYLPSTIINSADFVDWNPATGFYLYSLTSAGITLDTAHMAGWNPGMFFLYYMPNASVTITTTTIKNWSAVTTLGFPTGKLTQAQCDLILWDVYQIARTKTGGTIQLNYPGNAAPSGTFQACQYCPVTSATPGKEIAHELLNDGCGKGFNKWATVTTN